LRSVGLYKGETLPRCCHCQVSPALELDSVASLVFPLRLVLANPLLVHLCHCSAWSSSKLLAVFLTISRISSKKTEGRTPSTSLTMPQFVEMFESLRWTLVVMYLCIVGGVCLLLVFHVHIHRPLPHELRRGSQESPMYLLPYMNSCYVEV
jgi:hypothetical protein